MRTDAPARRGARAERERRGADDEGALAQRRVDRSRREEGRAQGGGVRGQGHARGDRGVHARGGGRRRAARVGCRCRLERGG